MDVKHVKTNKIWNILEYPFKENFRFILKHRINILMNVINWNKANHLSISNAIGIKNRGEEHESNNEYK